MSAQRGRSGYGEGLGTFFFLSGDGEKRPPKELYAVFRRPRNERDRRAGELASRLGALDVGVDDEEELVGREMLQRAALAFGDVVEGEGRLVLSGLGGAEDMLYVAPTTTGYVAHAVLPNGGGGCSAPGPDGLVLATRGRARRGPHGHGRPRAAHRGGGARAHPVDHRHGFVVHGLVADPIVAVDVVVDGETQRARMGENGFGLRIDGTAASALEKLILLREDGTANELDVGMPGGDLDLPMDDPR